MNPLALKLTNIRTFRSLDLTLPDGCVAVTGEIRGAPEGIGSNGAGKSTIPLAVELALFGPPPGFRTLQEFMSMNGGADRVEVELEFEHAGETLRVRRGWKKGKPTLDLEVWDGGDAYVPLTLESVKETQAEIERTIGLTQDTYRASSYLAQGDTGSFTEALPSKRKGIIAEAVLGRDPIWPRLLGRVREDKQAAEKELAGVEARLEQAEEELVEKAELENAAEFARLQADDDANRLLGLEKYLDALVEDQQSLERRAGERRAAEVEHQAAEQERLRLNAQADVAETARKAIVEAQEDLRGLCDREDLAGFEQEYSEARARWDREQFEIGVLRARWIELSEREHCPTCGRPFDDAEALAVERLKVYSEMGHREMDASPEPDGARVHEARTEVLERARLEERIRAWQQTVDAVEAPERQEAYLAMTRSWHETLGKLQDLPPVDEAEVGQQVHEVGVARIEVAKQRERLDQARTEKARLEAQLERLDAVSRRRGVDSENRDTLRQQLDVLAVLDRAYGANGIPALIVENVAIPVIETEANRILRELGTPFRVELRTQREKADGQLADALDIVIVDEAGHARDYATYSGGERTRIAISLRVALAVYMATHGAESRVLIIDEPEGLDEAGMAALAGVMRRLGSVFSRQLLVSHVPALRDAFDSVIHVVKEDGMSKVVA